jgi:hypothetical protein
MVFPYVPDKTVLYGIKYLYIFGHIKEKNKDVCISTRVNVPQIILKVTESKLYLTTE